MQVRKFGRQVQWENNSYMETHHVEILFVLTKRQVTDILTVLESLWIKTMVCYSQLLLCRIPILRLSAGKGMVFLHRIYSLFSLCFLKEK